MAILVMKEQCTACGICVTVCPEEALCAQGELQVDQEKCTDCLICVPYCPNEALKEKK